MNIAARFYKSGMGVQVTEGLTMLSRPRVPAHFSIGTKYVVEGRGPFVRRYIEFPNGRRVQLATRMALSCTCAARHQIDIVPEQTASVVKAPSLRSRIAA